MYIFIFLYQSTYLYFNPFLYFTAGFRLKQIFQSQPYCPCTRVYLKRNRTLNLQSYSNHTTTGERLCFRDLGAACFEVTSFSCYNCTSLTCFCWGCGTAMGPLLLLLIIWQVVGSFAIGCCCGGEAGWWLFVQLAAMLLLLVASTVVWVDLFTSRHVSGFLCDWCTTSSLNSRSTPVC